MATVRPPTDFKCNICQGEMKQLHFTEEGWIGSAYIINKVGTTTSKIIPSDSYRCSRCGHLESFLIEEPQI
jgi:hypothetical protein